jgi:integrase
MTRWKSTKVISLPPSLPRIRDLAGIPEEYRPNYCLRDTVASRLLSSGATLDEVAYQLGHSPGSPMTRRYARFLESAQRGIADRTQRVMDEMLWPIDTELRKFK